MHGTWLWFGDGSVPFSIAYSKDGVEWWVKPVTVDVWNAFIASPGKGFYFSKNIWQRHDGVMNDWVTFPDFGECWVGTPGPPPPIYTDSWVQ
jgi:hypothetical protein